MTDAFNNASRYGILEHVYLEEREMHGKMQRSGKHRTRVGRKVGDRNRIIALVI